MNINVINDYYDAPYGVGTPNVLRYRSHIILIGIANAKSMLNIGLALLIAESPMGIYSPHYLSWG